MMYIGESNRFEIIKLLGKGGMGSVYKAYDTQLQELVAIKSINHNYAQNESVINMFLNEAKTSLSIIDKNIVRVRDVHLFNGDLYIVMDFIDGIDLKQWMKRHQDVSLRDAEEMYTLIKPIFKALSSAHKVTVHRDIKPANIMIDSNNKTYLMDFGIATVIDGSKIIDEIKEKSLPVGTKNYMPPEQKNNANNIDQRVDIYAMGVIYYELLTGDKPNRDNIALASHFNSSVTVDLDSLILKMLAPNREDRYFDCLDIIADMDAIFNGVYRSKRWNCKIDSSMVEIIDENFVTIPKGYFYRGSGMESTVQVEKPRAKIYLDSYQISIFPVTNSEYLEFLQDNCFDYSEEFEYLCSERPNHPVTNISWDETLDYCKWIGGELPTEAQWEKASRGKGNIYPWGDEFNEICCNIENRIGESVAVDSFEAGVSPYGCYQMSGNVWEWCLDDYVEMFYKTRESKSRNPISVVDGDTKVIRGGSYDFVKSSARSSYRYYAKRNHKDENIGFRIVLNDRG